MIDRLRPKLWLVLVAWFVVISAMRLSVLIRDVPGYDGMLYRNATIEWLAGRDPWATPESGAIYAAPPPTLLAMVPFAVLPENVARPMLLILGVAATVWMLRRLRMPLWWLTFPPLVDGLWIANPHVFVAPLIVAGASPAAAFVKLYGLAVPGVLFRLRVLFITAVFVLVSAPFLPWQLFAARWGEVNDALRVQSAGGGFSVWVTPLLLPMAVLAALFIGRARLAWWAVPVFWPFTQWYYSSITLPVLTPLAAAALSVPVPGATTAAMVIALLELWFVSRTAARRPIAA